MEHFKQNSIADIDIHCLFYKDPQSKEKKSNESALDQLKSQMIDDSRNIIVLGEGGSGKSTLLHQYIFDKLEDKEVKIIPVFISLAKYNPMQPNLDKWVAKEIEQNLGVSSKNSIKWLKEGEIIVCFDGLDEVPNMYKDELLSNLKKYSLCRKFIITCRKLDLENINEKKDSHFDFIELIPLNDDQKKELLGEEVFFSSLTQKLLNIKEENTSSKLGDTPLMLHVIKTISPNLPNKINKGILNLSIKQEYYILNLSEDEKDKFLKLPREEKDEILNLSIKQKDYILNLSKDKKDKFLKLPREEKDEILNLSIKQKDYILNLSKDKKDKFLKLPSEEKDKILNLFIKQEYYISKLSKDKKDKFLKLPREEKDKILKEEAENNLIMSIWDEYDKIMFHKKLNFKKDAAEKQEKLRYWFIWLSKNIQPNSNIFFIEQLQPSFIQNKGKGFYYIFSRIILGILIAIATGFFLSSPFDYIYLGIIVGTFIGLLNIKKNKHLEKKYKNQISVKENKKYIFSRKQSSESIIYIGIIFLVSCSICISYLGFFVPRQPQDMILNGLFARTEVGAAVFMSIFFTTIFGLRMQWQTPDYDIRPIEIIKPNNLNVIFKKGFLGAFWVSIFLYLIALCIENYFQDSTFGLWLTNENSEIMGISGSFLGIVAGFAIGFPIFTVIASLNLKKVKDEDKDKDKKFQEKKYFSNHGINESLKNSIIAGIIAGGLIGGIFALSVWYSTHSDEGLKRGAWEGIGAAIMVMLWFGFAEFIQHWCIRLTLFIFGYSPFFWNKFIRYGKSLTFIKQSGASYQFFHRSLKDYYSKKDYIKKDYKYSNIKPINNGDIGKLIRLIVIVFILFSIYIGYKNRYWDSSYWSSCNSSINIQIPDTNRIKILEPKSIIVQDSGTIFFNSDSKYKVGTFTGYISSIGTEVGFLGLPLGNVYDTIPNFPHGALLFKKAKNQNWQQCKLIEDEDYYIEVNKFDTISFLVNDKEWHNNAGEITLSINFVDEKK